MTNVELQLNFSDYPMAESKKVKWSIISGSCRPIYYIYTHTNTACITYGPKARVWKNMKATSWKYCRNPFLKNPEVSLTLIYTFILTHELHHQVTVLLVWICIFISTTTVLIGPLNLHIRFTNIAHKKFLQHKGREKMKNCITLRKRQATYKPDIDMRNMSPWCAFRLLCIARKYR